MKRSPVEFGIFENLFLLELPSAKATTSSLHSRAMPGLSPRLYPRIFTKRQWTCTVCLKFQIKRDASSLAATLSGPRSQGPLNPTPIEPPLTESPVRKSKTEVNASRFHLKNRGQYYVTTPIFYVNGGIVPWVDLTERRSSCRTYAFNDSSRRI